MVEVTHSSLGSLLDSSEYQILIMDQIFYLEVKVQVRSTSMSL
jgi:hypothetical protein